MRETEEYYFFWEHQFGQWTQREMIDPEGISFNCCEQYMMYQKALLFKDKSMALKILAEEKPSKQQQLGREIKNYSDKEWDKHKLGIVWYGNYLKFTQHDDLRQRLLSTGTKILAESSPYDLVWGVGFRAEDDRILDQSNWKGKNLLGQVLMLVRSSLQIKI